MTNSLVKTLSTCLMGLLLQLETADDDAVNSDFAIALTEMVAAELQSLEPADAAALVSMIREMADAETDSVRSDILEHLLRTLASTRYALEKLMVSKWHSYRGARVSGSGPIEVKNFLSYWGGRSERHSDPIRPCLRTFLNEGF